ncbi:MAG TPA: transcriptional regulator Spx [Bacilli bacterium]|jgi:regulatory protein spx|nr:transcriptional regulator Spx [Bacilli bacterium]NLT01119.1 transcriptional regulator Spx [Acholeplasmataceae bacterium]HNZ77258.1 transcriptional regulator Spx [Bacilli bacterium]HOD60601.1 transcriptional regulator Spx [Bacilli bacterium]HOE06733.1 transcriptional regulator Spx [Bacilli bacterium]
MLRLYTSPSCASCRKVKKYFNSHKIPYVEKNIINTPLTREDIFRIVTKSENGFEDIISSRSKIFKEKNLNVSEMKTSELIDFIIENPTILRRPIIVAEEEIQVGYNDDDITLFLPPEIRERECFQCFEEKDCPYIQELNKLKEA